LHDLPGHVRECGDFLTHHRLRFGRSVPAAIPHEQGAPSDNLRNVTGECQCVAPQHDSFRSSGHFDPFADLKDEEPSSGQCCDAQKVPAGFLWERPG
jgi:hypothetical protein